METITYIRLFGEVDRSMHDKVEKKLLMVQPETCIFLLFDSVGGDLEWARKICSLLRKYAKEKNLITVGFAYGNVYSAALRIFLMCHYRLALPTAKFIMHLPKDNSFEMHDLDLLKVIDDEIDYHVTMTGAPKEMIRQLFYQGVQVNTFQAFYLGITNEVDYVRHKKPFSRAA